MTPAPAELARGRRASPPAPSPWLVLGVFLAAAAWMWWICGQRLFLLTDEGMYLEGATRILEGQTPYRDFLCLTGPGTDLLLAGLFRLFGVSLASARLLLVFDYAAAAAVIFALAARRAGRAAALLAVLFFLCAGTVDPNARSVNHRLDSATCALISIALAVYAQERASALLAFAAGFFGAAAAWITPTLGLLLLAMAAWMLYRPALGKLLAPWTGGILVCSLAIAGWLAAQEALIPFVGQLQWNLSHYGAANRVSFGSVHGGYAKLFSDASLIEGFFHAVILLAFVVPILLPPFVYGGWCIRWARRARHLDAFPPAPGFLLAASLALLLSTYPRWDLTHLVYISPVFYVLAAWLLADTLRPAARLAAFGLVAFYSVVFSFQAVWERRSLTPLSTGIGVLRGSKEDIAAVRSLTQSIPPGRTVFSFPYLVMMGFLVQGRNPTSFPYLQPGLMDAADESAALAQLSRTPPEWIVYADVPPEAILRMWPSSDPARLRFPRIEAWIAACYERTLAIPNPGVELQVLRPRGGKIPPSCREPAAR